MSRLSTEDLFAVPTPEQAAISPDGTQITYVLRTTDLSADRDTRSLWTVGATEGEPRKLTTGTADTSPTYSPDGTRIAFLRSTDGPAQLWVLPVAGGEAVQITEQPLGAGAPVWSPDGSKIAFLAPVGMYNGANAPLADDKLGFKFDGAGRLGDLTVQVHIVSSEGGDVTVLTDRPAGAGTPVWSPDGTQIAYGAGTGNDLEVTEATLFVVDLTARRPVSRQLTDDNAQLGATGWTRDGKHLIALGKLANGVGNDSLFLVPLDGGAPQNLTGAFDRNVMAGAPGYPGGIPAETEDGAFVYGVRENGWTNLARVDRNGTFTPLVAGDAAIAGISLAAGRVATVVATGTQIGEVTVIDVATGSQTTRTSHTANEFALHPSVERRFQISDGVEVTAWIRRDPSVTGPTPLLLDIHGGPHNSWNGNADIAHAYHHVLVSRGWTVLTINPRGSDGYGEEFMRAVLGGWGVNDHKDFLEPIDTLVSEGIADPKRLAITGYSYGGYMTCYLTSRDDRFAAAVPGGVVADLVSTAGTSDAGHFLSSVEQGAMPWEDPAKVAAQNPFAKVQDVNTPTLIVHGAADDRCPVGQAEQWFTALREREVPTEMVLYPGGSHLFILLGPPSHRIDWNNRVVDWVERYANGKETPSPKKLDAAHWQRRLSRMATAYKVPGATLGILRLGEDPVFAHHGILNANTGVETTDDSVFQIGSISKVWTATVVMQLVDEGLLDLDQPVSEILPDLQLSTDEMQKNVTMRHLLTHTSGIDGDVMIDPSTGDDAVKAYTDLMPTIAQNHPVGKTFSYSNAGFVLAGRVIEHLTGQVWDDAMRDRLYKPLGLTHTATRFTDVLFHRAATGHTGVDDKGNPTVAAIWSLPRAMGPAGIIVSQAADVLEFARMHLNGGVAADGTRVLSEKSAAEMQEFQTTIPDPYVLGDSWGLGWIRFEWGGKRLIGHDGTTIGQNAYLRILPEEGLAVVLLTNGGSNKDLFTNLYTEIFGELAGVTPPRSFGPTEEGYDGDLSYVYGRYERAGVTLDVVDRDGQPWVEYTLTGPMAELLPTPKQEFELTPIREGEFGLRMPGSEAWNSVIVYQLETGEQYLHFGVRAAPKVS